MQKEVFEKLFEGYLLNTLSELETDQLMQVIRDGTHDDLIKEKIDSTLSDDKILEEIDPLQADLILGHILSQPKLEPAKVVSFDYKKKARLILFAASVAALMAIGSIFYFKSMAVPAPVIPQQSTIAENPTLEFTGKQLIHLPDGSTILLNKNSSITYNQVSFDDKTREVTLKGEAYFDIKRNESKPFIVHTGKVETKVLGTAFNINAYSNSNKIEVTVTRGKVQVGDVDKVYGIIVPNQQIKVNTSTLEHEKNNVDAAIAVEWKSKYLILDNIKMEEAISLISQKYKVAITLSNENIKKCRITASFLNDEDLDHILKVICSVIETEYHYNKDGSVILEGKGCQ